jgi:hypothetical protein
MPMRVVLCGVIGLAVSSASPLKAQPFNEKAREVQKKANKLRDDASAKIPADVGRALEKLAKQEGIELEGLKAYVKAAGMCDKDYDDKKESVVPDLFSFPKKERPTIALKFLFAETAIAWYKVDPKFEFFLARNETVLSATSCI